MCYRLQSYKDYAKQKSGATDISHGKRKKKARGHAVTRTPGSFPVYEKSRQKLVNMQFHSREATKVWMRRKRDKKDKTKEYCHHLGWVCPSFQWSLSVISVKFAGHFSEVCRSFQLFLSVIPVVLWSSGSAHFRISLLFNDLTKTHEKREKSGREPLRWQRTPK